MWLHSVLRIVQLFCCVSDYIALLFSGKSLEPFTIFNGNFIAMVLVGDPLQTTKDLHVRRNCRITDHSTHKVKLNLWCIPLITVGTLADHRGILRVVTRVSLNSIVRTVPHTLLTASTVQIIDVNGPHQLSVLSIQSLWPWNAAVSNTISASSHVSRDSMNAARLLHSLLTCKS